MSAYQTEYRNYRELKETLVDYIEKYNYSRLYSALGYQTPAEWYFSGLNATNMPDGYKVGFAA